MELALQVKVGKVASFVGKIFVVIPSTTNISPTKITLYTVIVYSGDQTNFDDENTGLREKSDQPNFAHHLKVFL